jgi:hypothetical protein
MKNNENDSKQKTYFIFIRSTGEKVPVSKEQHDAFYKEADRIRHKEQDHGRCIRTGFPCHFNVRRKRGHPEKSVSFARNKKAALKSCKNAKPQSGRCSQRYVDIIPVMEYNLYRIRKGHNKP